jgi:hypothetical protein
VHQYQFGKTAFGGTRRSDKSAGYQSLAGGGYFASLEYQTANRFIYRDANIPGCPSIWGRLP